MKITTINIQARGENYMAHVTVLEEGVVLHGEAVTGNPRTAVDQALNNVFLARFTELRTSIDVSIKAEWK